MRSKLIALGVTVVAMAVPASAMAWVPGTTDGSAGRGGPGQAQLLQIVEYVAGRPVTGDGSRRTRSTPTCRSTSLVGT